MKQKNQQFFYVIGNKNQILNGHHFETQLNCANFHKDVKLYYVFSFMFKVVYHQIYLEVNLESQHKKSVENQQKTGFFGFLTYVPNLNKII